MLQYSGVKTAAADLKDEARGVRASPYQDLGSGVRLINSRPATVESAEGVVISVNRPGPG